jgi:hypothetical protein
MKTPQEMTSDILKSLNNENAPERSFIESYLEKAIKRHRAYATNEAIESFIKRKSKFVIIDLRNMDFMKDEEGGFKFYDTREEASDVCGMYEFENAWVMELLYNHIEPKNN